MVERTKQTNQIKTARGDVTFRIDYKAPESEILKDAKVLGAMTTVFEDETTRVLRQGTEMAKDAFEVFDTAYRKMLSREVEVEGRVKAHVSSLKDKANQVAEAMGRINKLAGPDLEIRLAQLERFANAVETLDTLNRNGKLQDVANAIRGLGSS